MNAKTCTKCLTIKDANCFGKRSRAKDGLQSSCKECCNKYASNYYLQNFERLSLRSQEWYTKNSEKVCEVSSKYRINNSKKIKDYQKQYYANNKQKVAVRGKQYRSDNPEKLRSKCSARRAKKLSNGIYQILTNELKILYSSNCFYCGSNESVQMDHVIPIIRGGTHSIGNIVPACAKCNQSKGSKLLIEWKTA